MNKKIYNAQFVNFDGVTHVAQVMVVEESEGSFYATDIGSGLVRDPRADLGLTSGPTLGCGKTCSSVVHWKPVRAAIEALLGGRQLVAYTEVA